MPFVYIMYSKFIDHYYIGYTTDSVELRVQKHLTDFYKNKYTAQVKDRVLQISVNCLNEGQAKNIEKHIKKMKSRKYIADLIKYPEIVSKLLAKYS